MKKPTYAAVFDLDGTLVDSLADLTAALNLMLNEFGRRPLSVEQTRRMVGDGAARLVERAFAATGQPSATPELHLARFLALYEAGLAVSTAPFPGAREALGAVSAIGCRLALCSNKPHDATLRLLTALDLVDAFDVVAGGDSFSARKPDPTPLLGIMDALGLEPGRAVMIGDHENDVRCARAANVPVIAVSFGYSRGPAHSLDADRVIDSFAELPAAVRTVLRLPG